MSRLDHHRNGSMNNWPVEYGHRRAGGFGMGMQHEMQNRSPVPYVFDRFGIDPSNPPEIPAYRVINDVPLPCKRDKKGLVVSLLRCFNCGASDHKLQDCKQQFHRDLVNMNKSWMNDYARIGQKSQKESFNARYFASKNSRAELPNFPSRNKEERSSNGVSRRNDDSKVEDEPELLQVWTDAKDIQEKKEEPSRAPRTPSSHNRARTNRPMSNSRHQNRGPRARPGHRGPPPPGSDYYRGPPPHFGPRGSPPSNYGPRGNMGYPHHIHGPGSFSSHGPDFRGDFHNGPGPRGPYRGGSDRRGDRRPGGSHNSGSRHRGRYRRGGFRY